MIVDSSALIAIALDEPESDELLNELAQASIRRLSAANLLEIWMVVDGQRIARGTKLIDGMLTSFNMLVEPVTGEQVGIARIAFNQYGKGSGHGARLNFGDCFAYALAKHLEEPLLFVGNDFSLTDITPALRRDDQSGSADRE